MSRFFIDTASGQVATLGQLIEAGLAAGDRPPERPWHQIQGPDDASTLWYAVMRKRVRGVHIGALAIRHQPHHASLLHDGWEEIAVPDIRVLGGRTAAGDDAEAPTTRC